MSGLLAFAVSGFAAEPATPKDCSLKMFDSIDIVVGDDVYVPVEIDGHAGVMSLSLESGISYLDESTVGTLGLKKSLSPVEATIDKKKATQMGGFKALRVGKVNFGKGRFLINRGKEKEAPAGLPNFGSLGTEVFKGVDFELDLSRNKLNLFSQDHCPGRVVYWADEWGTAPLMAGEFGTIYFPVELEGLKVETTFAPSEELTRLKTDVTRRLYGFDKTSPGVETEPSPDDSEPMAHFRAMELTARGMSVRNSRIRLTDPPDKTCSLSTSGRKGAGAGYQGCHNIYPMALGRNVLSKLRLYFATQEKMLYFTIADATRATKAPAAASPAPP